MDWYKSYAGSPADIAADLDQDPAKIVADSQVPESQQAQIDAALTAGRAMLVGVHPETSCSLSFFGDWAKPDHGEQGGVTVTLRYYRAIPKA